ncbi:DUF3180 domain-containing protein [Rothia sp. LK2588]|uniref:DUF3180 domain-containing protein n=1 Tax=Rothia sp. LK2588 TaxID=3114369 RepID=UPI0034CD40B4
MTSLKVRALVFIAVLAFAVAYVLHLVVAGLGGPELQLPASFLVISVLVSAIALWRGVQVRAFRDIERRQQAPEMNPLMAARTAIFAQACAYTGAVVFGWHVAMLLHQLGLFAVRAAWYPVIEAGLDILAGLIMVIVGLVVENMCKIPPSDSDADSGNSREAAPRDNRGYARHQD